MMRRSIAGNRPTSRRRAQRSVERTRDGGVGEKKWRLGWQFGVRAVADGDDRVCVVDPPAAGLVLIRIALDSYRFLVGIHASAGEVFPAGGSDIRAACRADRLAGDSAAWMRAIRFMAGDGR